LSTVHYPRKMFLVLEEISRTWFYWPKKPDPRRQGGWRGVGVTVTVGGWLGVPYTPSPEY